MQRALDRVLRAKRFDLVNLEFSFLAACDLRQAPPNEKPPRLVVASHNIDYELARQYARGGRSLPHRLYAGVNWRKLRREELGTYRDADGVYLCSAEDERRLLDSSPESGPPSFPTRRMSSTTSLARRTRRRTVARWSFSGSSPTPPMSTA